MSPLRKDRQQVTATDGGSVSTAILPSAAGSKGGLPYMLRHSTKLCTSHGFISNKLRSVCTCSDWHAVALSRKTQELL